MLGVPSLLSESDRGPKTIATTVAASGLDRHHSILDRRTPWFVTAAQEPRISPGKHRSSRSNEFSRRRRDFVLAFATVASR